MDIAFGILILGVAGYVAYRLVKSSRDRGKDRKPGKGPGTKHPERGDGESRHEGEN